MSAHELVISGLRAELGGVEVLHGVDLSVPGGEVHVLMGPNGSGKSTLAHALMGRPGTTVTGGSVTLDGHELLGLAPWERARAGLFLALQQPIEVPGVRLEALLAEAGADGGGSSEPFNRVAHPIEFRKQVQQQIEKLLDKSRT